MTPHNFNPETAQQARRKLRLASYAAISHGGEISAPPCCCLAPNRAESRHARVVDRSSGIPSVLMKIFGGRTLLSVCEKQQKLVIDDKNVSD